MWAQQPPQCQNQPTTRREAAGPAQTQNLSPGGSVTPVDQLFYSFTITFDISFLVDGFSSHVWVSSRSTGVFFKQQQKSSGGLMLLSKV